MKFNIVKHLLFLTPGEMPDISGFFKEYGIEIIKRNDLKSVLLETDLLPDAIFCDFHFPGYSGGDVVLKLKSKWNNVPIIIMDENFTISAIREIFESGAFNFLQKPLTRENLLNAVLQSRYILEEDEEYFLLLKNMIKSEDYLQEKSTILETILDMLSHDSRNLFINMKTLLSQLPADPVRSMLEDCLDELTENTMEAVTYLKSKKRIFSVLEMLKSLKITSERTPLTSHARIKLIHPERAILFVESTALIKNAVINLIENALKYSPEESPIIIQLERTGENIFIHIKDRGKGVPEQDKKNIFQRYFRLQQDIQIQGTGRGLWIAHNIISKENGEISVSDNPGGGSVFTIKLPVFKINDFEAGLADLVNWFHLPPENVKKKARTVRTIMELQNFKKYGDIDSIVFANLLDFLRKERKLDNQKHFRKKLNSFKEMNPDGKKVLIVDDSIYVHYYLGEFLTSLGYRIVDYATNGADAVSLYHIYKPEIITLDFTMPVMSGPEAAKQIYKKDKNVKILFITGLGDHEEYKKNLAQNLPLLRYNILTKPIKKEDLSLALEKLVG